MNKTVKTIITVITFIIICVFIVLVLRSVRDKERREEDKLYSTLNTVVKDFYKDYYYNVILGDDDATRKLHAESYKQTGISYTLDELAKYKIGEEKSILDQFKNYKTNLPCDYKNTKIVIYPHEPYGSEDIRIESNIVCGFR
jgi:hypothetical protein